MGDRFDDEAADWLASLRADIDQIVASAPELARIYRGLFDAFRRGGFTEGQALYLAVSHFKGTGPPPP